MPPITILHIHRFEFAPGESPGVTQHDLDVLKELLMSILTEKITAVTTAIEAVKARVEAAVPTQADLDALDAAKTSLDGVVPAPVVPPPVEPAPPVEVPPTV